MDGGARIVIETHQTSVLRAPQLSRVRQIWAIGGGKGGVGKSLVASSISIALSRMGLKVTAVDLDLGGANLHTSLGADLPRQTLSDFFSGRVDKLTSCLVPSGIPQLELISGAQDAIGVADIDGPQKMRLMTELRQLESDFVILDLGAGTSYNTLDFFIHSDVGIVTILPEPTSIENAYRFIKSLFYRRLALSPRLQAIRRLIDMTMNSKKPKKHPNSI
jgi:flagellar biosynthesis protein FlhG